MIQQFLLWVYNQKKKIITLKKYLHSHIHCSVIHNSQDIEKPKYPSTDEWIKKLWYISTMEYH